MTKKEWYEAGDQIKNLVQDAVDKGDFSQLSGSITNIINETVDDLGDTLRDTITTKSAKWTEADTKHAYSQVQKEQEARRKAAAQRVRQEARYRTPENRVEVIKIQKQRVPGSISGNVMRWTGYSLGGIFGFCTIVMAILWGTLQVPDAMFAFAIPTVILGALTAGSFYLGSQGSKRRKMAKRFNRYMEIMGERTFCKIEELAAGIGENKTFVRKDLKLMIQRGFFRHGYLDQKATCLITDPQTYQQYLETQQAYQEREAKEAARKKENKKAAQKEAAKDEAQTDENGVSGETQSAQRSAEYEELIAEGREYIRHIHQCNDRIPGEVMSEKLDRLELVVARIFNQAEKKPEIADELKKMMSYYLPTTRKLLDAYCELDQQPIQGENIAGTKREIEQTLDTLNEAFERLLDSLFEEQAWDISSDISVLNTLLAQEGLTRKDFQTAE